MNTKALSHAINGRPLTPPWPEDLQIIGFGMGCFWGAERLFWQQDGVYLTRAGYQGGDLSQPTYQQVCQKQSGHAETVQVIFDPAFVSLQQLLAVFWENHDPTQGNAQGNDLGPQYRSMIFAQDETQAIIARDSLRDTQVLLDEKGFGSITTQISVATKFWLAEEQHQQYLAKNPDGYCNLSGTGIACERKTP
ncbi:Peptide-methionine (S)-S-oxide reductase MsrA [hydrothermal vent metagenome]|uniref:peptide-methionine (S)-S-oxide reductase n=1 Tax=hydrothermal vent metagenome TaxID=652676 RepID=A0A3B0S0D6_9ZZZZ